MELTWNNIHASFVNLDQRPDRLQKMYASIDKLELPLLIHRTQGILPEEYSGPTERIRTMLSRPQKGAIGCFESQLRIMRDAYSQDKHAFVMEDDLVFCSDFKKRLEYLFEWSKTHTWDIAWLGGTFHVNPPYWHKDTLGRDAELTDDPRMIRTYGSFCTYAYIVNVYSITKILDLLEKWMPLSIGIDWSMIQISPQLKTYAFVPGCITQYDNQSNIGQGMTYFSKFAKLNGTLENSAYWYQDKMEDFDPLTFNWAEARVK